MSKARNKHIGKDKHYELVISAWRKKVYALLVQQKSGEISHRKEVIKLTQQIQNMADQLARCGESLI